MIAKNLSLLTLGLFTSLSFIYNMETTEDCEIDKVHGYLKYTCKNGYSMCHNSKEKYRVIYSVSSFSMEGSLCSNDPHGYQACASKYPLPQSSELLCGATMCYVPLMGSYNFPSYHLQFFALCDENTVCQNTEYRASRCNTDNFTRLRSGRRIASALICNEECDLIDCEDEANCDGYSIGAYCERFEANPRIIYVPPGMICNRNPSCSDSRDESTDLCTVTDWDGPWCKHIVTNEPVPVHNFTRCAMYANDFTTNYCSDFRIDKSNCSNPEMTAGECKIYGYWSTIFKEVICDKRWPLCDDGLDDQCLDLGLNCNIHKHYMCDGITDCKDGLDENHFTCSIPSEIKYCKRKIGRKDQLPIPPNWFIDGVEDCVDGTDERSKTCGIGPTKRHVPPPNVCQNAFICPYGGMIELTQLCDGVHTCGNENQICALSRNTKRFSTAMLKIKLSPTIIRNLSYCIKGIPSIPILSADHCVKQEFDFPGHEIFGLSPITLNCPHAEQNCDHLFGESYVLNSCLNKCKNSICVLKIVPSYHACPGQINHRVGTIADNKILSFVVPYRDKWFFNHYFVCDGQSQCIDYSKVCDLVQDCNDATDEERCTNHFKCSSSEFPSSNTFITKTKLCDGVFDCMDLSDECNEHCSKQILGSTYLKVLSILIGGLAFIAYFSVITRNLFAIRRCRTAVAVANKSMVILIALGDFIVGSYLLSIAFKDMVIYSNTYCRRQLDWLLSNECATHGVLSTIGSQISLFAMTILSIVRLHGIQGSLRIPGRVNIVKISQVFVIVLAIILTSTGISLLPLSPRFEDYFVNGVKYQNALKLFIGTTKKPTIQRVLEAYYGRMKNTTLSWSRSNQMISEMFSHDLDYEDFTKPVLKLHFYGNDGVCLFKYFVGKDDPQKIFVWGILMVNFTCFLFISLSYIIIGMISRSSSSSVNNNEINKRNRRINQRISIIILTDFCCWIPFIVICGLHSIEVLNATPWYSIFSMLILPVNSVINPLLYDNFLTTVLLPFLDSRFVIFSRRLPVALFHSMVTTLEKTSRHASGLVNWLSEASGYVDGDNQGKENENHDVTAAGIAESAVL